MRIIRVFPTRTSFTPVDDYAFYGNPTLFIPEHDEVHISTVFTWDIPKAKRLKVQWQGLTDKPVKIGGPAFDDPGGEFVPGRYVKKGITITSRGCPNNCWFCFVPKREGDIRELEIHSGNIMIDNNLLACSEKHLKKVFEMLGKEKNIVFSGGVDAEFVNHSVVQEFRKLSIKKIHLAYDEPRDLEPVEKAISLLSPHYDFRKIGVYILCGYKGDTVVKATERCEKIYNLNATPFVMMFQPRGKKKIRHNKEWNKFKRLWIRHQAMHSFMKSKINNFLPKNLVSQLKEKPLF